MDQILRFFNLSNSEKLELINKNINQGYSFIKQNIYPPITHKIDPYIAGLSPIEVILLVIILYTVSFIILRYILRIFCKVYNSGIFNPFNWQRLLFKFSLAYIPFAKRKFKEETAKMEKQFQEEFDKLTEKKMPNLPLVSVKYETIADKLKKWIIRDNEIVNTGKISGCKYVDNKDFEEKMKNFCKEFFYSNPLHCDLFPACRQMEAEVVSMTAGLFGQQSKDACGCVTSGGTESIAMAMLTYRNWARNTKGITAPEMIMPVTAHSAFDKAASYYGIKVIRIPLDKVTWAVDLKKASRAINKNTICLVGSAPNFPHGVVDPIPELGALANKHKIGLHVDGCLGGFVIPWAHENGSKIPKFDFTVTGVTSISVDHHKYGLAPKGVSVVLYKNKELRHHQYYSTFAWPGGVYATPGAAGSRSGAPSAGAWFAMMTIGQQNYRENSKMVLNATKKLAEAIDKIPGLKVIAKPEVCVVSFLTTIKTLNIYRLHYALSKRGWCLSALHKPAGIHISVTLANAKNADLLIKDIKECLDDVLKNPENYKGGSVAMYGSANTIPDNNVVEEITKYVVDAMLKL